MSIQGDIGHESTVGEVVEVINRRISESKEPAVVKELEQLRREVIDLLPNRPTWSRKEK